jgi:hypothetical protein
LLLDRLIADAKAAEGAGSIRPSLCPCKENPGYFRVEAQVLLSEPTFDEFFNGRSGYRAQHYLSPEEGVLYNRAVINGLAPIVQRAYTQQKPTGRLELVAASLGAPHAKVWVFRDTEAFNEADPDTLNPQRWAERGSGGMGRRVPLPSHLCLDLKGAFIHPESGEVWVDPKKADRPCDIFRTGFT